MIYTVGHSDRLTPNSNPRKPQMTTTTRTVADIDYKNMTREDWELILVASGREITEDEINTAYSNWLEENRLDRHLSAVDTKVTHVKILGPMCSDYQWHVSIETDNAHIIDYLERNRWRYWRPTKTYVKIMRPGETIAKQLHEVRSDLTDLIVEILEDEQSV